MDCSPPGSSVHGISQARILEWGAISYSSEIMGHTISIKLKRQLQTQGKCVSENIEESNFWHSESVIPVEHPSRVTRRQLDTGL